MEPVTIFLLYLASGSNAEEMSVLERLRQNHVCDEIVQDGEMPSRWLLCITANPAEFYSGICSEFKKILGNKKSESYQLTRIRGGGKQEELDDILGSLPSEFAQTLKAKFRRVA